MYHNDTVTWHYVRAIVEIAVVIRTRYTEMQQWPFEFTSGTHRTHIERDDGLSNWNGKSET